MENKTQTITFNEFSKLDLRIGKILKAEKIPEADKLLRLEIALGNTTQQMVAGIAEHYSKEQLEGKLIPVIANLEEKELRGTKSQGMILAADLDGKPVLLHPDKDVPEGSKIH